jgi:hypothetical protein
VAGGLKVVSGGETSGSVRLDRRAILQAMLVLAGGDGAAALAASKHLDLEGFRELMIAMTGYLPRDPTLADAFFEAFSAEVAELQTLAHIVLGSPESTWDAQISTAKLDGLAQALVSAFYTGIVGEGAEAKVITYINAFAWYACGYTKPPSQCDWNFGAWAYPPPPGRLDQ